MANKTIIEVSEKSEIQVFNPRYLKGNVVTIKLGNDEIHLYESQAMQLQTLLEMGVVNEAYWYETLKKENEKLQDRIGLLEEKLECLGEDEE